MNRNQRIITASFGVGASLIVAKLLSLWFADSGVPSVPKLRDGRSEVPVIPLVGPSFDVTDASRVMSRLRDLEGRPVILLLHTLGAGILPAVQIARAVRRHGNVTAFVPFHALSAGTLVALAAQRVFMWQDASLGPVDPQIGFFSASSLIAVVETKTPKEADDYSIAMAHEARKALLQTETFLSELVDNKAAVDRLVSGATTHSYPISLTEAIELGLNVELASPSPYAEHLVRALIPGGRSGGGQCECRLRAR